LTYFGDANFKTHLHKYKDKLDITINFSNGGQHKKIWGG